MNRFAVPVVAVLVAFGGCSHKEDKDRSPVAWPKRAIQVSCFAAAGGGTDMVNRAIGAAMEGDLGVRVNVINRVGGRGGVAMDYVWSRGHDGHHWGGFSETILPAAVMGGHNTTAKDWTYFLVAGAPGVLSVAGTNKYKTLEDLLTVAREQPGKIRVSASATGGLWHTKLVILEKAAGVRFNFIPYEGSQPSQIAALSGEVEAVITSLSEQAELIKGRRLIPLAVMEAQEVDFPGFGSIPSAAEKYPVIGQVLLRQWLGFALPADAPQAVLDKIGAAFDKAMASKEIQDLAAGQMLTLYGLRGQPANEMVRRMESFWTWMLYEQGIASKSPAEFGIPRPAATTSAPSLPGP